MRQVNYTLKPATIDNAKPREKAYALTDGGGLQLEVLPSGSKTWRFKYHLNGKREKVTIGACPAFTCRRRSEFEQQEVAQAVHRMRAAQRQTELPGMTMDRGRTVQRVSPEPSRGPDMSR